MGKNTWEEYYWAAIAGVDTSQETTKKHQYKKGVMNATQAVKMECRQ